MNERYMSRGKRVDNGEWVEGSLVDKNKWFGCYEIVVCNDGVGVEESYTAYEVDPATVGQCTGLPGKNGKMIFVGDITRLVLPDGEVRHFEACIKTVVREVVSHPDFDDPTAKVSITGVVFKWQGYELFPCLDVDGVSDVSRMEVIGNTYDNPELLEAQNV